MGWGTLGQLTALSLRASHQPQQQEEFLAFSMLSISRLILDQQNIAMHSLKSFENLQTRNPIRILQLYLDGDIISKSSLSVFVVDSPSQ